MNNLTRKALGFLAIGSAAAGAAYMAFNSKKGRELYSKIKNSGSEILNEAGENFRIIRKNTEQIIGKTGARHTAGKQSTRANTKSISRGDSILKDDPKNNSDVDIDRGDGPHITAHLI